MLVNKEDLIHQETTHAPQPIYPQIRGRRLRVNANLRRMVRETTLTPADFIYPLFIRHGNDFQNPILSMPGQFQWSLDRLPGEIRRIV